MRNKKITKRNKRDFYPTPMGLVHAICGRLKPRLDNLARPRVFDPGCGDGRFANALSINAHAKVEAADLTSRPANLNPGVRYHRGDVLEIPSLGLYDLAIGNPPYSQAQAFVESLLQHCYVVAFLLPLSFLCSQRRMSFWQSHPLAELHPILQRPSFSGDGKTDAVDYGLFVWEPGNASNGNLCAPIVWEK